MVTQTVTVDDTPGVYHIPGVHNMQVTLCGFVDTTNNSVDAAKHPCNCVACISAFKKIKALRFPRYYFTDERPPTRPAPVAPRPMRRKV